MLGGGPAGLAVPAGDAVLGKVAGLSHPNLVVLRRHRSAGAKTLPTKISVDAVRRALDLFASTAADSGWRVCILDSAEDLRIKMCIDINAEDFTVIHHELGHNFYQRAYSTLPMIFRDSATDGFHEAVGAQVLGKVEHVAFRRGQRVEPAAAAVDHDHDPRVAAILDGAARALLHVDFPAIILEQRGAADPASQFLDFGFLHSLHYAGIPPGPFFG